MMQIAALLVTTKFSPLVGHFPMPNMVNADIKHVHVEESLTTKLCLILSGKNSPTKSTPILPLTPPLVLFIPLNLSKQLGIKFTLVSLQLHYNIFPTKNIQSVTSNTSFPRKQHIYTPTSKNLAILFDTLNLLSNIPPLFLSILTLLSLKLTTLQV